MRLPGVYRPQADTHLLADAIRQAGVPPQARVLDLCTGTGSHAITAANEGAGSVLAVDVSRRALACAWLNGRLRRLPVRVRRGNLMSVTEYGPFDMVVANPPYVPAPMPPSRSTRAWNAGADGRAVLGPLCEQAYDLLTPDGFLLLVHSSVSDVDMSLTQLRETGLKASIVARKTLAFGPVMRERAPYLERLGYIEPGSRTEEVVVLRADRVTVRQ